MTLATVPVRRLKLKLNPDPSLTIMRFFWPGDKRAKNIITRILSLSHQKILSLYNTIIYDFGERHCDLLKALMEHYHQAVFLSGEGQASDVYTQFVIGAYFTMEYAYESSALFNPSMIPYDTIQPSPPGTMRFMMSLRGVGEGHISSIVFRIGAIDKDGSVTIDTPVECPYRARPYRFQRHEKRLFFLKIIEMGGYKPVVDDIMDLLPDSFLCDDLKQAIQKVQETTKNMDEFKQVSQSIMWLARSNYEIHIDPLQNKIDQVVLFPVSEAESNGMEDMRMVRLVEDDGSITYYGTYTAFNGYQILPQLFESNQKGRIQIHTLRGIYAQNKGHALFPRKIDGLYMMISRMDGENIFLLHSDNIRFWNKAERIRQPEYPWEFVQIGNCGSPIETEQGWLLLTHGVGPMRRYCISAILLDRNDPSKIIGRLDKPLLVPTSDESSGYVPNVVYSCGGLIHNDRLILPYGISDLSTGFAIVELKDLLVAML